MRKLIILIFLVSNLSALHPQPPQLELSYSYNHIPLQAELDKQVCISGIKYFNGELCLVSERCPVVFILNKSTHTISRSIPLQVPQEYEMEGITSYKDKLYLVSENIAAVYEVNSQTGELRMVETSVPIPPKSKDGDGMEGIAANETHEKFYLLRERNEEIIKSQIYTFGIERDPASSFIRLKYESVTELPLDNIQWRYSDICFDSARSRLLCLKSYSKGKLRQLFIESVDIGVNGNLLIETLKSVPVDSLTENSAIYKLKGYSTNLEGITIDEEGHILIVSDNHSGKAICDMPSKEKTILVKLKKY